MGFAMYIQPHFFGLSNQNKELEGEKMNGGRNEWMKNTFLGYSVKNMGRGIYSVRFSCDYFFTIYFIAKMEMISKVYICQCYLYESYSVYVLK